MPPRKIPATNFGKDVLELIQALTDHGVEFILIGGHAVGLIRNKKSAGRKKDLDDVRFLEAARKRAAQRGKRRRETS